MESQPQKIDESLIEYINSILSHMEKHVAVARKAFDNKMYETLDYTLAIIAQDATHLRAILQRAREHGLIGFRELR